MRPFSRQQWMCLLRVLLPDVSNYIWLAWALSE